MANTPLSTQDLPPVPSAQTLDNKGSLISQPWQQWFVNLRDKVNVINAVLVSISGASSVSQVFNTISPLTTNGDLLTYNSGSNIRLPIGTNGQILSIVSGLPTWINASAGSSPLTTKGDIYGYGANNARIPVGTDGQVLTARSSNALGVDWETPTGASGYPNPPFSNVLSLLHFNGTNGSTTFTDQVAGNTWTAHNATINTSQYLFGGASGYFTGASNSCITIPSSTAFQLGASNFTLEMAFYLSGNTGANSSRLFQSNAGDVYNALTLMIATGNTLSLYMSSNGSSWNVTSVASLMTLSLNTWYRVLVQRVIGFIFVYINGLLVYLASVGTISLYSSTSDTIAIGGQPSGTSRSFLGYIDEFRLTGGVATGGAYPLATSEFPNS